MPTLYLVRHAWPEVRPDEPAEQWPLSEQGRAHAVGVGQSLRDEGIRAVRSSPEPKALETAELIADQLGLDVTVDRDLGEARRTWVAEDYETFVARFFAEPEASANGWERAIDAQRRMVAAVDRFAEELGDGAGLIVSHGLVLSLYLAYLALRSLVDLDDWRAIRMPDLAVVELPEGRLRRPFGAPTPYRD